MGTESGLRPIGKVEAGERVWGYDFLSGVWRLCVVECRHDANYDGSLVTLYTDVGQVTATAYHPFWVIQGDDLANRPTPRHIGPEEDQGGSLPGRWVNSHDLREGDIVFLKGRGPVAVWLVKQRHEQTSVCNLTVQDLHTFAVGEMQILVHNQSGTGLAKATLDKLPGKVGKTGPIKEVPDAAALNNLFDTLTKDGKIVNPGKYPGEVKQLPDGTIVRRRPCSKSGGPTLDITLPDGTIYKVHVK